MFKQGSGTAKELYVKEMHSWKSTEIPSTSDFLTLVESVKDKEISGANSPPITIVCRLVKVWLY